MVHRMRSFRHIDSHASAGKKLCVSRSSCSTGGKTFAISRYSNTIGYPCLKEKTMSRHEDLTEVEVVILEQLQRDARLSSADLAEQLNLTNTPVWRRIKKMQESGLIDGYHAHLNAQMLGFGIETFLSISVHSHDERNIEEFSAAVATVDEIVSCYMVSGYGDFLLRVVAKDMNSYADFITRVAGKLPGVREIRSSFVMRTLKSYAGLPIRKAALG